jgi:hypothetical protein
MSLHTVLMHLSALSVVFPIGASIRRRQTYDQMGRVFGAYFYSSALFDLAGLITWHKKVNNLPLFHLFTLIELLFFGWVYKEAFENVLLKKIVAALTVLLGVFTIINSVLLESIWTFNSISATAESVYLIVLSLLLFRQLLLQREVMFLDRHPLFWLNSGVLLYFAGNLFVFMLQHAIAGSAQKGYVYGIVHSVINILANLLFGIALLCRPRLPT